MKTLLISMFYDKGYSLHSEEVVGKIVFMEFIKHGHIIKVQYRRKEE